MNIDQPQLFAALANETRLRCLHLIARNGEVCVCEVVAALGVNQPSASKALNTLKAAGLLTDRRDANWNYYALSSSMPEWMAVIVAASVKNLTDSKAYIADQKRFKRLDMRTRQS